MDALIALLLQYGPAFISGAASLLIARLVKAVPDVHSQPASAPSQHPVIDAVKGLAQHLLSAQVGGDSAALSALKVAAPVLRQILDAVSPPAPAVAPK